ncbi:hypothetical protein [Aliarcobacter sp.]|uniref:hypothetical protein n=1 Tax=Aliarcobacter sp. TaxID=2321116 RepID=UPI003569F3E3
MSYETQNFLPKELKLEKLFKYLQLNNFVKYYGHSRSKKDRIADFSWFENNDYKSWTGVELSIYRENEQIIVYTRTSISKSYYDLMHQNNIVLGIRDYFGGYFVTDEGKNKILKPDKMPSTPPQSGCHLAFQTFGMNIIKVSIYLQNRQFAHSFEKSGLWIMDNMNPKILSNNLLLPYLISVMEDYFKSTYIALLKYSENKEKIFKDNNRIGTENLIKISNQQLSIEESLTESMSFQNIELISKHFQKIDSKIDIKGLLSKPYKNRKTKLFESINELVQKRHKVIHSSIMDLNFDENKLKKAIKDVENSIDIFYKFLTEYYNWNYEKGWHNGT